VTTAPWTPTTVGTASAAPYDALLLLGFGGPEGPDDVMPFLENVTRGRGIPRERLVSVAEHYLRFGGRSPINDQNRALLAELQAELGRRRVTLPVFWGNRNWDPYVVDALREAAHAGAARVLVLVTSAYSSYSGCRQYREDLAGALAVLAAQGHHLALDKVRHYYNHPGFTAATVDAVARGLDALPTAAADGGPGPRIVFVTHSVPAAMNAGAGPTGGAYERQHQDVCRSVVEAVRARTGRTPDWELAYCSRSGQPGQAWLDPDVDERVAASAADGVPGVVVVPIGFISDHMEVLYDLDTQAREVAERAGLPFVRAATVGTDPRFVEGLVDLVLERAAAERGQDPVRPADGRLGPSPDVCPVGCCPNPRGNLPAACGADRP
jgi:ferrochelatase